MREDLENVAILAGVTVVFLVVTAILTLVLGRLELTWALTKGFLLLWLMLLVISEVHNFFLRLIRANVHNKYELFVGSNVLVVMVFCLVWTAFNVLQVLGQTMGLGWLTTGIIYFLGLVSSWIGFGVVTTIYNGTLYQMLGLFVTAFSYVIFCIFPNFATQLFGWFFGLF
ncbi:MAG: hypothetical protein RLZZ156_2364 [Deinococcota bacterium]|jgi:hypothetical protein